MKAVITEYPEAASHRGGKRVDLGFRAPGPDDTLLAAHLGAHNLTTGTTGITCDYDGG